MSQTIQHRPDYKKIYRDLILYKYPEKIKELNYFFEKENFDTLDITKLNEKIFGSNNTTNQKYRSYDKAAILKILDYQKKYHLNNSQLANQFSLSRNTITKWKKIFL